MSQLNWGFVNFLIVSVNSSAYLLFLNAQLIIRMHQQKNLNLSFFELTEEPSNGSDKMKKWPDRCLMHLLTSIHMFLKCG